MTHQTSDFTQAEADKTIPGFSPNANSGKSDNLKTRENESDFDDSEIDADALDETDSMAEADASASRDELIAPAKKIFGEKLEFARLTDPRIPAMLSKDFARFGVTSTEEFLAVNCGSQSNLAAIALPFDMAWLNEFFALNPVLRESVLTVWANLIFLWVRVDGWRPANRALPRMVWISEGLLPTIVEKAAADSKPAEFQKRGEKICTVKFQDLKWRQDMAELFLLDYFVSQYGPLIQRSDDCKTMLNYRTAAYYLAEILGLFFDKNQDVFRMGIPGETKVEAVSKGKLNTTISSWLNNVVAKIGRLPPGDHVQAIIRMLKDVCAVKNLDEPDGLADFLDQCLERRAGSNITTKELFMAYSKFCKFNVIMSYPECVFLDVLTGFIRKKFALTKVHNVMRPNEKTGKLTARYGFNGLGLKEETKPVPEMKDQKEDKDGEEAREGSEGRL